MKILLRLSSTLVAGAISLLLSREKIDGRKLVIETDRGVPDFDPDLILVDYGSVGSLEFGRNQKAKVILLDTGLTREEVINVLISYKLHGILSPETDLVLFKKALSVVNKGQIWFDNSTMKEFIENAGQRSTQQGMEQVTEREKIIIQNICQGYRNREIASRLSLSEQTVKAHLNRIFKKLSISSRSQLTALAIKTQLFPSGSVSRKPQ